MKLVDSKCNLHEGTEVTNFHTNFVLTFRLFGSHCSLIYLFNYYRFTPLDYKPIIT